MTGTVELIPPAGSATDQDVNLVGINGVAPVTGHGSAAGALRVELPTDGTGIVGLAAGSAIIGKVSIDQTTPGTTNGVVVNSSALPTGAATSALQTTGNTSLATIATNSAAAIPAGTNTIGGVYIGPTSASAAGIGATVSTVAESNHVLKSGAGNLYSLTVSITTVSGYVLVFDATSAPADGAVAPIWWFPVVSNGTFGGMSNFWSPGPPLSFLTGCTAVFSSTGPFTKTASATAAFSAQVQ